MQRTTSNTNILMIPSRLLYCFTLNETRLRTFTLYNIKYVKEITFSRYLPKNNLKIAVKLLIQNLKILKHAKTFNYHPRTSPNVDPSLLIKSFEPFLYRKFNKSMTKIKGLSNFRFFKPFRNLISLDTPSKDALSFPIFARKVVNAKINLIPKDDLKSNLF